MIDENKLRIEEFGFCLSLHCSKINTNDDSAFKDLISKFLFTYSGHWVKGTFWENRFEDQKKSIDIFIKEYEEELSEYSRYFSGIQTRVLGNIVINDPSKIINDSKCSLYIISFRKIHHDYEILFFTIGKNEKIKFSDLNSYIVNLEKEAFEIWQLFFKNCSDKFNNRYYLPYTKFYFSSKLSNQIPKDYLIDAINNKSSHFYKFLNSHFCAKGVAPNKMPISVIDDNFYVIRHHSYYFSQDLPEKFIFLPTGMRSELGLLVRTIDIFASIEFYYTKFFNLIKGVYDQLREIDEKSKNIIDSIHEVKITTLKPEEADKFFIDLVNLSQELLPQYSICESARSEIEHMFSDASHLIENIIKPSIYSQILEKPFFDGLQGAIESIGLEFKMRLHEVERNIPRSIANSYHNLNALITLLKSYHEHKHLTENQKELLQNLKSQDMDTPVKVNKIKTNTKIAKNEQKVKYIVYTSHASGIGIEQRPASEQEVKNDYLKNKEDYNIFIYYPTVERKIKTEDEGEKDRFISVNIKDVCLNILVLLLKYKNKSIPYLLLYNKAWERDENRKRNVTHAKSIMETLKSAKWTVKNYFENDLKYFDISSKNKGYICEGKFSFCLILNEAMDRFYTLEGV